MESLFNNILNNIIWIACENLPFTERIGGTIASETQSSLTSPYFGSAQCFFSSSRWVGNKLKLLYGYTKYYTIVYVL